MTTQPALAPLREHDTKERGAVFTKPAVVEFMLDLIGYQPDHRLFEARLLEPSFGDGRFLVAAADRLVRSWKSADRAGDDTVLDDAIRAVEVDGVTFQVARDSLINHLVGWGVPELSALRITKKWLVNGDFLLADLGCGFDYVVGNPPYVRQEMIPGQLLNHYRASYQTMVGRADLYVPFFEKGLGLLADGGLLCFICADAWTKNEYGRVLRRLVTERYGLKTYVDMYGLDAFETSVGAYPSITVIAHGEYGDTRSVAATSTDQTYLLQLGQLLASAGAPTVALKRGEGPWLLRTSDQQSVIQDLESRFDALEQVGCRVGIGVATGADKVFLGDYASMDVEESRKLPLAVNRDIIRGEFKWHGQGVINPWAEEGGLVDLSEYPRLSAYLSPHQDALSRRHTAKGDPARRWYKTIDRITASLTWRPKLLVPDIRGDGDAVSYDPGTVYPHHNLYFITSTTWDLRALQALLRSGVARLFVDAYAVRIGGGYLRFQAQYLRRIRLPQWDWLDAGLRSELACAGRVGAKVSSEVVERVYGTRPGAMAFTDNWGEE